MKIEEIQFNSNQIKLTRLFCRTKELGYIHDGLKCKKVEDVYGDFLFPPHNNSRTYTFGSYVMSIDGKIAFEDNEVGPLIAKNNYLDPDGGFADFWILNLLRATCDAIIIGSGTLIKEPTYSGSAYDPDLLQARLAHGKPVAPLTVIVSRSGENLPYANQVFHTEDIPILINVSPEGLKGLLKEIPANHVIVTDKMIDEKKTGLIDELRGKLMVFVTGKGRETDADALLTALKRMGIDSALIESPTYCHYLMKNELLDEIFINTSCIFVGGSAAAIGSYEKSFGSTEHPHAEIVSMHMHSPHFYYIRYKMNYRATKV
ncbi:dihydrofolate reductase family protein [Treponema sp. OMZ 840]|uniref:RibD family protein n=1 Tax=Treponema sp. OMZ 840 TaxID=244313 RepID=UPI003D8F1CF2